MSNGNLSQIAHCNQPETIHWDNADFTAISPAPRLCGRDGSKMGDTWELHGRNMGATVDETWSYVELVWSYGGRTVELVASKKVG